MRRFFGLLLLSLLSLPAFAADPPAAKAPPHHRSRTTWEKHFALADQAHDGHLTLTEAQGGDALVAKNFSEIDAAHKGYVTEEDVRAWRANHKEPRRRTKPRIAAHSGTTPPRPVAVSATGTVVAPQDHPTAPAVKN
jgi:hypothetical protein